MRSETVKATVRKRKQNLILIVTTLTVVGLTFLGSGVKGLAKSRLDKNQPVIQQRVAQATIAPSATGDIGRQVYKQLPDLPLENKYVSKATGQIAANNTLVERLIRYHTYVKRRPINFRLDWKLTLADYLGANELMEEAQYPGYDTLRQNPFEGDRTAIASLNHKQRNALVQTLVDLLSPNTPSPQAPAFSPSPQPSAAPSLPQSRPGDAQLLMP